MSTFYYFLFILGRIICDPKTYIVIKSLDILRFLTLTTEMSISIYINTNIMVHHFKKFIIEQCRSSPNALLKIQMCTMKL